MYLTEKALKSLGIRWVPPIIGRCLLKCIVYCGGSPHSPPRNKKIKTRILSRSEGLMQTFGTCRDVSQATHLPFANVKLIGQLCYHSQGYSGSNADPHVIDPASSRLAFKTVTFFCYSNLSTIPNQSHSTTHTEFSRKPIF